ncbi:MAG: UvrD-helicase domain-containing protein [Trueperaceae bacterium]
MSASSTSVTSIAGSSTATTATGRGASSAKPLAAPSPLQQRVLAFVAQESGHGVVEATAGSGKTTTLVQVAQLLPRQRSACFLAFNRATAAELKARLPAHVEATTVHALGRSMVVHAYPALAAAAPDAGKYRHLALQLVQQRWQHGGQPAELAEYLARLAGFVRLATGADRQAPPLAQVHTRHGLESPVTAATTALLQALVPKLLELGLKQLADGVFDYTDMLYAPLMLRLTPPAFAFVCVDEAQDLSPLTLALVMRLVGAGARALFVGDPQQAIYAFAGADSRSLQRIVATTSATVLPLSVSFRCPSRHVALARRFSPTMQAAPGAPAGHVRIIDLERLPRAVGPGDLIMCRVNAPLASLHLRLAEARVPSRVLGEDMVEPTLALARHLFGAGIPRGAEGLVAEHARQEAERLERELLTSPALAEVLRISAHRHQALGILLRRLAASGPYSVDDLERTAHHLLGGASGHVPNSGGAPTHGARAEHPPPRSVAPGPVVLSTIHKAKGREARRIFLLFPEELAPPVKGAGPEADERSVDAAAEANVLFVALTRAKQELVLVERTRGALAARLTQARRAGPPNTGPDAALARSWEQVLSLASLMARGEPRRRWWRPAVSPSARAGAQRT